MASLAAAESTISRMEESATRHIIRQRELEGEVKVRNPKTKRYRRISGKGGWFISGWFAVFEDGVWPSVLDVVRRAGGFIALPWDGKRMPRIV